MEKSDVAGRRVIRFITFSREVQSLTTAYESRAAALKKRIEEQKAALSKDVAGDNYEGCFASFCVWVWLLWVRVA